MADKAHAEERDEDAVAAFEVEDRSSVMDLDPATLDADYKYRWAYNHPNRIARMKAKGYEFVVLGEDSVQLQDPSVGETTAEGHIRIGDSVLMRCRKDRYGVRRNRIKAGTEARLGDLGGKEKQEILKTAQDAGVRTEILTN